jgi:hypothetical protein
MATQPPSTDVTPPNDNGHASHHDPAQPPNIVDLVLAHANNNDGLQVSSKSRNPAIHCLPTCNVSSVLLNPPRLVPARGSIHTLLRRKDRPNRHFIVESKDAELTQEPGKTASHHNLEKHPSFATKFQKADGSS